MIPAKAMPKPWVRPLTTDGSTAKETDAEPNTQGATGTTTDRNRGWAAEGTRSRATRLRPAAGRAGDGFGDPPQAGEHQRHHRQVGEVGDDQRGRGPLGDERRGQRSEPEAGRQPDGGSPGPRLLAGGGVERGDRQFLDPGGAGGEDRPAHRAGQEATDEEQRSGVGPTISTSVATTDITAAGPTTVRRPHRSDAGPPTRRAGISPRA